MPRHPPQPNKSQPRPLAAGPGTSFEAATLAGLILSLPPREGLPDHSELPDGCYNHPVVVLSSRASSQNDVVVLLVRRTTLVQSSKWQRSLFNWLANSTV